MCGIVGYIGNKPAQPVLLGCLARLEYRGYDSCGVAIADDGIKVNKNIFRVKELARTAPPLAGMAGIGHTRWATCGQPSRVNAHPHCDCSGNIAVVHNGIIANFQQLKQQLIAEGHHFASETDTEVLPHLIEKYYSDNLEEAVESALADIKGSYAIVVLRAGESKLVVARQDSPLIIGIGDHESFVASDVPAILDYTNRVIYLEEGDIGIVTDVDIKIRKNGAQLSRKEHKITWSVQEAQKAGYEHFMLKEIHEQPRVVRDTLVAYSQESEAIADLEGMRDAGIEALLVLACGTSYHAALVGKYIFEELLRIPVRAELASEFNYYPQTLAKTMAIVITQSGETADTLRAARRLQEVGCHVLAITNVVGSTVSRLADTTVYTRAGPEISVASTKSFIAQLVALYWLVMSYSRADTKRLADMLVGARQLPNKVQQVLDNEPAIKEYGSYLSGYNNVFFIGRGINYPVALEGALKLKEVSYIHAEGYAAGELKHGPFALLDKRTPVVAIVARDNTYGAMLNNIREVKTRGAPIVALVEEGDSAVGEIADFVITVPSVEFIFSPLVNTVVMQLLAYYAARERDCPIDFPRNLAKSVTVE
ncbi:MAG: glutamine--fructose-6-phosphate transaminase (isomerizing) [Dehalococcoidales bacterium]